MAGYGIDTPTAVRQMTVEVHWRRHKQAMFRIRVAVLIIRVAIWIGGFGGVNVSEDKS